MERSHPLVVCVVAATLPVMDITKVYVTIPDVEQSLDASPAAIQLMLMGFVLAFVIVLVPSGRFGDLRSRRGLFLAGLSIFGLASLAAGLAPSTEVLVVSRVIQGVGGGMMTPQVFGFIQQLYSGAARSRALGVLGAVLGVASAFGPPLGGALVTLGGPDLGWRLAFFFNVPLAVLAVILAVFWLPKSTTLRSAGAPDLDPLGILLFSIAVITAFLPLVLPGDALADPTRYLWLVVSVTAAFAFVRWERRYVRGGGTPMMDVELLRVRSFRNGVLVTTFYYAAMPSVLLVTAMLYQSGLGLEALTAGIALLPISLAFALTSWLGGRHVTRLGRALVLWGLVVLVIGLTAAIAGALFLPGAAVPAVVAIALGVAGLGAGATVSPNQALSLADVGATDGGQAGSIQQIGQRLGTAIGISVASTLFYSAAGDGSFEAGLDATIQGWALGILSAVGFVLLAMMFSILDLRGGRRARVVVEPPPGVS